MTSIQDSASIKSVARIFLVGLVLPEALTDCVEFTDTKPIVKAS